MTDLRRAQLCKHAGSIVVGLLAFSVFAGCVGGRTFHDAPQEIIPTPENVRYEEVDATALGTHQWRQVFWVGQEYAGLPIDRVLESGGDSPGVLVLYGTCGREYERGCKPPLAVRTGGDCARTGEGGFVIRDRQAWWLPDLTIETGRGTVSIIGERDLTLAAAQSLSIANLRGFPELRNADRASLPGSLCQFYKLPREPEYAPSGCVLVGEPHEAPTRVASSDPLHDPAVARDVIRAMFPSCTLREGTADEVSLAVGWRALRTTYPRYEVWGRGMIAETFLEIGIPRIQQRYAVLGRDSSIDVVQEPEAYGSADVSKHCKTETIANFQGCLWKYGAQVGFQFLSGESINGQPIHVSVYAPREDYTLDDIRHFVSTLTLE